MAETTVTYDRAHGTIITAKGLAEITAALANDQKLNIVQVAFGDGGGEEYIPDAAQTDIKNEVYAVTPSGVYSDALTSNSLVVTALIPSDVGGWTVREAALRLPGGEAVVIATMNPFPKVAEEKGFFLKYEFVFPVSNTAAFEFKYDPNTEAVREYVRVAMLEHNDDPDAHGGIIQQAADNVANAVEQVKNTDKELRELVSEKLREIQASVTKTVVESKTAYRFTMTKSGATVRLNTETLPSSLPELAMLYGQATADYLYSDSIFINDTPVRLLTPTMYPIAKAAWSSGGGIQLLWKTAEKQLFYQMSHNSSGTGNENGEGGSGEEGGGNESGGGEEGGGDEGGETPAPVADDWVNDKDYIMADLAYGSNKALYEAIAPSGPGQAVGPRDPVSEPVIIGVTAESSFSSLPFTTKVPKIAYGDDKYVVVIRDSNKAAYSRDGTTWTQTTLPAVADWNGVTYGNGRFVAIAYASNIAAYSTDGINWTAVTLPVVANWNDVVFGNNVFVAIAYGTDEASQSAISAVSTIGTSWTKHNIPSPVKPYTIAYGGGKFVVTGNGPETACSADGKDWTASTIGSINAQMWRVAYGNGVFVAMGTLSTRVACCHDGSNWTIVDALKAGLSHSIAFSESKEIFISLTDSGFVQYTRNGVDWVIALELQSSEYWSAIASNGVDFVGVAQSSNGIVKITTTDQVLPNCWKQVG